ncbi:CAP domain-containing protein [Frankia gtarii]|uniref:CAP domain-containing protein n=1 Tax=Frankia gtarii TaxID=2950102 RepID=UPI0021C25334|nr:CAP domain-containing protein [Frankia gtarii]
MTELVPGANAPLPRGPVSVRLIGPFDLCALVTAAHGKVDGDDDFVFYNQPATAGVILSGDEVMVDPELLRPGAERVVIAASPEDGTTPFGQLPGPVVTLHDRRGKLSAHFTPPPLTSETVVTLIEIYRRGSEWKVRAVGQGYADGLAGLARDFGVDVDDDSSGAADRHRVDPALASLPAAAPRPAPTELPPQAPDGGSAGGGSPGAGSLGGSELAAMLADVVTLTNVERGREGLAPLAVDARLAAAAEGHCRDMAARGFFAHTSPDGRTVSDRVTDLGYRYARVAENIAAGQTTAEEVVAGWMQSPGHRANILIPQLRQIGIGHATGGEYGSYWTQVFGVQL